MSVPRLSVVVPFYNNAELLGDCLASIAAQTFGDLEVIMVDDGSTDGSAAVAAEWAAADSRFRLVSQANAGPGAARNAGVRAASGEFLAFVDADDTLPPDSYATMLATLGHSGSDFVSGGVRRLTGFELGESGLHARAIKGRRIGTHIRKTTELCYDISVWNKVFRRSFWDRAGLAFPEGMLWEDLVAMTKAHVLASAVDVITDSVYIWRDRDKGAASITQSRTDIANFRDRITALFAIDDFLRERGETGLLRAHQHKALVNDLWLYVRDLPNTGDEYVAEFATLARGYLATVDPRLIRRLPAGHKLAYHLISAGRVSELADFARWQAAQPSRTPPLLRSFGRLRADLPFRAERGGAIPAWVFRPNWRELDPQVRVDRLGWRDDRLVIEGRAYIPSVDIGSRRHATKLVALVPAGGRRPPVIVPARSVFLPDATAASDQSRYSYDWAGFRCEIGPRLFRVGQRWLTGDWDCFVLVRGRGVWRPARLHTPGPEAEHPQPSEIGPGLFLAAVWSGRRLRLRLSRATPGPVEPTPPSAWPVVTGCGWDQAGRLELHGQLAGGEPGDFELILAMADGAEQHALPVDRSGDRFAATIPVAGLASFGQVAPLRDGTWRLALRPAQAGASLTDRGLTVLTSSASAALSAARPVTVGNKTYQLVARSARDGASGLAITAGPAQQLFDRSRVRRKLVREFYYRAQRLLPIRDEILFVCFNGKSTADNPGGIAAELRRRADARRRVWAVSDWSVHVPAGDSAVLTGTAAYFAALGRSRWLIANDHMPQPYRKRPGQRYIQTWHGTPLKRLGYDIVAPSFASGRRYFDFMAGDVAQWDALLSPCPFATPIFAQAFRYPGQIWETGYPRNDGLLAAAADPERLAAIRGALGLPADRRIAIYVPTWRDDLHDSSGAYLLDFRLDLAEAQARLGNDYVLLIRAHHLMTGGIDASQRPGFAYDVSGYPDIADLLAISDVLITDYSSVMFDYAPTGRPIVLFTYDLDRYRDQVRGFYFDLSAQAPGPLLASGADVVDALADLDAIAARYAAAHAAFTARYCPLDDQKASARACDAIFGG